MTRRALSISPYTSGSDPAPLTFDTACGTEVSGASLESAAATAVAERDELRARLDSEREAAAEAAMEAAAEAGDNTRPLLTSM
jgi:hypothetical protein